MNVVLMTRGLQSAELNAVKLNAIDVQYEADRVSNLHLVLAN
jgi:hypothetical protein